MNLTQQRMDVWVTSAQRVETDALMSEVRFAAHESMRPMWIDREGSAEQIDVAVLTAAAQEDHGAFERGTEVELEAFGGGCVGWMRVLSGRRSLARYAAICRFSVCSWQAAGGMGSARVR